MLTGLVYLGLVPAQLPEKSLPVPGYAGFYEISTSGQVRSLPRAGTAGGWVYPWAGPGGRLHIRLSKYGRTQVRLVGVLVLLTHGSVRRPSRFARVWYRDGDITNNSLSNLSWAQWPGGRKTGMPPVRRGEDWPAAKLTGKIVADCRRRWHETDVTGLELCAEYGVSSASMSQALHGVTWAHITDPPPIPREDTGRARYARSEAGRAQRRRNVAVTNKIRYG